MIDSSELNGLAADFSRAGSVAVGKVRPIVSKGALNIKNRMQKDASASRHFGQIAPTIDYHINATDEGIEAEIGPNKARGRSASLAGLAYFGSSRPGGATVMDPIHALNDEAGNFVEHLAKAVGFIFE
ncbi:hypothetical protein [Arthrobacter sp. 260]|uniref:hypothetical protein n=1 Tax=Arthrobacter sp. 260 TaxID=2735314 RepID=UPI0014926A56|nr:hypothetical protein [Arthrobacter sp. 260]NOJ59756.1 hypothetical protein [Arthrobacter sp. 260]